MTVPEPYAQQRAAALSRREPSDALSVAHGESILLSAIPPEPYRTQDLKEVSALIDRYTKHIDEQTARRVLALGFDERRLEEFALAVTAAIEEPFDYKASMGMIGLMAGSFPNARPPDADTYLEMIVHDSEDLGFSPTVVAGACRALRRSARFLPTIAEFIEAAETFRSELLGALHGVELIQDRLTRARAALTLRGAS